MRRLLVYILLIPLLAQCASQQKTTRPTEDNASEQSDKRLNEAELIEANTRYFQGVQAFELEHYEEAAGHLEAARAKLPDSAGVNYALADAYLELDELGNAAHYGKIATQLAPQNKWYHQKLYEIYRAAGKNQATIAELERILQYHPKDIEILERLARTYNDYGSPLKAIDVYNRILGIEGPDIQIHMKKFQTFQNMNMRDSTLRELQIIRQLDPNNLATIHTLGEFYLDHGYPTKARETLQEALQRNPRNPRTLIMMAESHMQQHQWDSAGTMLQNLVTDSLISSYGKMQVARFMYSRYKNQPNNLQIKQQTQKILTLLTEFEPDLQEGHALAADYYLENNQPDQALEHLRRTLELNPNNTAVWRERIRLLYMQQQHNQIIDLASKADQYAPQDPFITFFIGSSQLVKQNYEEAVRWLAEASSLPAKKEFKSIIFGSLGDAHSSLDQWEKADEAYEKALELDASNHNAMNNYAYYLSKREQQLSYAKKLALKALELMPGNASYLDTAGWVFYKLGNYEKALDYLKQAANTEGASTTVYDHLGDVYHKLDQLEKAHTWWKKAFQRDSSRTHIKNKIENNPIR